MIIDFSVDSLRISEKQLKATDLIASVNKFILYQLFMLGLCRKPAKTEAVAPKPPSEAKPKTEQKQ